MDFPANIERFIKYVLGIRHPGIRVQVSDYGTDGTEEEYRLGIRVTIPTPEGDFPDELDSTIFSLLRMFKVRTEHGEARWVAARENPEANTRSVTIALNEQALGKLQEFLPPT